MYDTSGIETASSRGKGSAAEDTQEQVYGTYVALYRRTRRTWPWNAATLHCSKVHPKPSASVTTLGVAVPAPGIYYSTGATWCRPATTFRCSRQRATPGFFDGTVCFPTSLLRFPFVASRFCITTVILVVHFYGDRGSRPLVTILNRLSNLLRRR